MYNRSQYRFAQIKSFPNRMLWHLNDLCNMDCIYCFFPKADKENPDAGRYSPSRIYEAFNKIGRQWHLFIGGGEPFLYPDFIELVNLLKKDHYIQITTNLYNKNVVEFARLVSPENIIMICASLHIFHHSKSSLQKFLQNYRLFCDRGFNVVVTYVTYPPLFERIKDDFRYLHSQGVQDIAPLTFQGEFDGKKYPGNYTAEHLDVIRNLSMDPLELLISMDKMRFNDRICTAGQNFFFMDIRGEVYRCVTIRNSLGNLFEGTFSPGSAPAPCTADKCNDSSLGIASLVDEPQVPEYHTI